MLGDASASLSLITSYYTQAWRFDGYHHFSHVNMRFNDKELRQHIKSVPVELEGNLTYFDFKDGKYLI